MQIAISHSLDPDTEFAIDELLASSQKILGDTIPQAGVLLSAIDHRHDELLAALHARYPGLELIGCSTDGELSSVEGMHEGSTTLMLMASERIEFAAGVGRNLSQDPLVATREAVEMARTKCTQAPKLCLITPESLTASASTILEALHEVLPPTVAIFGGTASDQWRFVKTQQFYANECLHDALPILLLAGDIAFSHGIASGWQPIGERCPAAVSRDNVVYKIGAYTAIGYYEHYLGTHPPSGEYPLAVFDPRSGQTYLRAPLTSDREAGTISFAGEIPQGALVQLTSATRDDIIAASQASVDQAICNYKGLNPDAALIFSCAARKQILGTRTREEATLVKQRLPNRLPTCGFYAYGEFAPLTPGGPSRFHNETIVTLLLGEQPAS